METKKIEEYGLGAFMTRVLEAAQEGYVLDLESNDNAPVTFGGYFYCVMVKPSVVKSTTDVPSVEAESDKEESTPRRGRKPKAD
jgi:hypothetical protein